MSRKMLWVTVTPRIVRQSNTILDYELHNPLPQARMMKFEDRYYITQSFSLLGNMDRPHTNTAWPCSSE
jgi:hypothetical protein